MNTANLFKADIGKRNNESISLGKNILKSKNPVQNV